MTDDRGGLCSDERIQEILAASGRSSEEGIALIDAALADCPEDARLHFLKGSMMIGLDRHIEAHGAMSRAVELAPDFHLARFQLGFFELTSGEVDPAQWTWRPLDGLPDGHYLKSFVSGLRHLIADRFEACVADLRAGMAANQETPPLNGDMQLIIARCEELLGEAASVEDEAEEISAASLLLRKH